MRRKSKINFGIMTIISAMISAGVGFWMLGDIGDTYTFAIRFVFGFFLTASPVLTILTLINFLKRD